MELVISGSLGNIDKLSISPLAEACPAKLVSADCDGATIKKKCESTLTAFQHKLLEKSEKT